MVMVLHKFALLGGKVPAATGMRAQQFSVYFLSEGVRFLRLMFFRRLCTFCGRDRTDSPSPAKKSDWIVFIRPCRLSILGFCGGEEWSPSPQGQANGSFLSTLAACQFWAFAVGKDSPHPRKEKQSDRFYPPLPPVDFGPLRWGRIVPIPARARQTDGFIIPYRPVLPTAG